jgi:HprK-related kinase B
MISLEQIFNGLAPGDEAAAAIPPAATPLSLSLRFLDVPIRVLTNDAGVWTALCRYHAPYVTTEDLSPAVVVMLIQGDVRVEGEFRDIARRPGKQAREAVREVEGGRLILKRKTGVVMGLWPRSAVACGDLRTHLSQAIDLINACYAKIHLERGYRLLHAAAVSRGGRGAVLTGGRDAGKTTAALHLVEAGFRFLSSNRLLARPGPAGADALGYPKQPRVNPGTLLHHPRLVSLLEPKERQALSALPARELWQLKRQRDVDVDAVYAPGTVCLQSRLELLVLLSWTLDGAGFQVRRLEAEDALARWPLYHKDLGVLDLDLPGPAAPTADDLAAYRELAAQVTVVEVSGRPDFAALVDVVGDLLGR